MRALFHVFAVLAFVLVACGKSTTADPAPSILDRCRHAECVTSNPCRKNDCSGELFWNGCCSCPPGTVNAFTCDGGVR